MSNALPDGPMRCFHCQSRDVVLYSFGMAGSSCFCSFECWNAYANRDEDDET